MQNDKGQTLLEMVVVIAVALLVVAALTFATISSLRNSQYAKNQAQATKLAQEAVEKIRVIRDRDGEVSFTYAQGGNEQSTSKFSELWTLNLSSSYCGNKACFFKLNSTNNTLSRVNTDVLDQSATTLHFEMINNFKRQVQISDLSAAYNLEKKVTAVVVWNDFAGDHESRITTILRNLHQ